MSLARAESCQCRVSSRSVPLLAILARKRAKRLILAPSYPPPPEGVAPRLIGEMGVPPEYLSFCMDVAVDNADYVYILEPYRIEVMDPFGNRKRRWSVPSYAAAMVMDSRDRIFVLVSAYDLNKVIRYDRFGVVEKQWSVPTDSTRIPPGISDIATGQNDHVFLTDSRNRKVFEYDSDGDFVMQTKDPNGVEEPDAIDFDDEGNSYIIDRAGKTLTSFDADWVFRWRSDPVFLGIFQDIAISKDSEIFITDRDRILVFDSHGSWVRTWSLPEWADCPRDPWGIGFDRDGAVYIAEHCHGQVIKCSPDGTRLRAFGASHSAPGLFQGLREVAVSRSGYIFTLEGVWGAGGIGNRRVQKFGADRSFIQTWGGFDEPIALAVGEDGSVYVADKTSQRITRFTSAGKLVAEWEARVSGTLTAIGNPVRVFACDGAFVQEFTGSGAPVRQWSILERAGEPPEWIRGVVAGIAMNPDGDLLLAAEISKCGEGCRYMVNRDLIYKFAADGAFIGRVGELPRTPFAMTLDAWGNIYVGADGATYRLDKDGNMAASWAQTGSLAITPQGRILQVGQDRVEIYGYDQ